MNNGNFFPSFDNNNNMTNNNTSLNMMNMQSMNQVPMEQSQEMVMPTMNQPIVDPTMIVPNSQPMEQMQQNQFGQPQVSVPMADEPLFNPNVVMPQAEPVMYNQPMIEPNPMGPAQMELTPQISPEIQQMPTPMFNNNSLFGPQPMEQPQQEQFSATPNFEMQPQVSVPMADEPLFNPNAIIPQNEPNMETPIETPIIVPQPFEVPVITEISEPTVSLNNIQTLQDFLNSNGYQFKIFGNENADCIIIEIPRN